MHEASRGVDEGMAAGEERGAHRWWLLPAAGLVVVVALVAGFGVGRLVGGEPAPSTSSAAAGFARDMQTHHAQAVDMSMIVRDGTTDEDVRLLAYDIALTQQHQIGQMFAWLVQWGLPQTSSQPPMQWMSADAEHGAAGHLDESAAQSGTEPGGQMPGMASSAQMRQLAELDGRDAEVLFLELMIEHHRGGVAMAEAVLERPAPAEVHHLASTMVTGQQAEIDTMLAMLAERGAG